MERHRMGNTQTDRFEVVSGGQTGVDRAALDVTIELGIPHGGWCPKGRRAEDGPIPEEYRLRETNSSDYRDRTLRNVGDSDGMLILTMGAPTGVTALTARLARAQGQPILIVDLKRVSAEAAVGHVGAWLRENRIRRLNIAGPRETKVPGTHERAREFLLRALPEHLRTLKGRCSSPDTR